MELTNTVDMMLIKAEYYQTVIRYKNGRFRWQTKKQ